MAELKDELSKRDLPTSGLKQDLADRLQKAIVAESSEAVAEEKGSDVESSEEPTAKEKVTASDGNDQSDAPEKMQVDHDHKDLEAGVKASKPSAIVQQDAQPQTEEQASSSKAPIQTSNEKPSKAAPAVAATKDDSATSATQATKDHSEDKGQQRKGEMAPVNTTADGQVDEESRMEEDTHAESSAAALKRKRSEEDVTMSE